MSDASAAVRGPMPSPSHPGDLVRHDCLEPLGLTVTRAAQVLGVLRKTLDSLVNLCVGVSSEMAVRLAAAFGSPRAWIAIQANYDYAQVRPRKAAIRATVTPVNADGERASE